MNQGEIIQAIRLYERQFLIAEERLSVLEKKVSELEEAVSSPIRREVYAARKKCKQEGNVDKHQT